MGVAHDDEARHGKGFTPRSYYALCLEEMAGTLNFRDAEKLTRSQWGLVVRLAKEGFGVDLLRTGNELVVDPLPLLPKTEEILSDLISELGK